MKVIAAGRGRGKTRALVVKAQEEGTYIVCANKDEASRIFREAIDSGFQINFPITYDNFLNGEYYGKGIRGFLIDNVDLFLHRVTRGVAIDGFTVNIQDLEMFVGYT